MTEEEYQEIQYLLSAVANAVYPEKDDDDTAQ